MEANYLQRSAFIGVHLRLINFLQSSQSIDLRVDVFGAQLFPIVGDMNQFSANMIGLL